MGFKVDTAELIKAINSYQKTAATATEELSSAKTAMNGIITSNAMHGQVGQAIEADINNNQNALIVGLADSYTSVSMEMTKLYQSFKETTGETSNSAVLKQDVLEKASKKIDSLKEDHQEILSNITTIYSSVADLISLTTPKSTFNESADEVKKYADKIIEKVTTFDSQQGNSANEDMLAKLKTQIQSAEKVGGLSYTDPQFLAFANSTSLAEEVQDYHSSVSKEAKKLSKEKEKDLNSMTPSEMIAKYGVDDPDVKKRINDINNAISVNGILTDTSLQLSEEYLKKNGYTLANGMFNAGTKYFGGSEVASLFYAGSKATSSLTSSALTAGGKAFPLIGSVIDYGTQVYSGEDSYDALAKTGAHAIAGLYIGAAIATFTSLPFVGAVAATVAIGYAVNLGIDFIYDNFKKPVGEALESVSNWVGTLWT